jgi:hypothetical protein
MEEDATLVTREQYIEMLIDASFREASEMESGFMSWCERHVPTWQKQGYNETWIRQRIDMAQRTRGLHLTLKHQGLTMPEMREELRKMYADAPELYDQEKEGETPLVKPNPLERTRQYIPYLKAYLRGVNPRLQDLPIIPVAAFSPKGDISAIHDVEHGMLYIHELPALFRRYARSARVPYPSLWVEQALRRVPTWDKIRLMNSDVWIHGILVDRELTFMGPDGRYARLPYAQIAAVGLQRDEPVSLYTTLTVRYVSGGEESFPCVEGQLQLTHLGKSQTYDLNMVSRILVGIANKFL